MKSSKISTTQVHEIFAEIDAELENALQKYPSPNPNTSALSGEAGEACEAMNKKPFADVRAECVQTAVTAIRLALEGDPFMDIYRRMIGLDHSSSAEEVRDVFFISKLRDVSDTHAPNQRYSFCTGWSQIDEMPSAKAIIRDGVITFVPANPAPTSKKETS